MIFELFAQRLIKMGFREKTNTNLIICQKFNQLSYPGEQIFLLFTSWGYEML